MDFDFITDRIATGAALQGPQDVQTLIAAGVTHVVDARAEYNDGPLFASSGVGYLWNPTDDDGTTKLPAYFAPAITFAMGALSQPINKVYLHCAAGVNRGPSNALAVMLAQGWDFDLAVSLMHTKRPVVNIAYRNDALAAVKALRWV